MISDRGKKGDVTTQEYGAIHKDREIKCPIDYCDGYFKIHLDKSRPDGALWSCSGIIRYPKKNTIKCLKR